jgi:hypothetical protein
LRLLVYGRAGGASAGVKKTASSHDSSSGPVAICHVAAISVKVRAACTSPKPTVDTVVTLRYTLEKGA